MVAASDGCSTSPTPYPAVAVPLPSWLSSLPLSPSPVRYGFSRVGSLIRYWFGHSFMVMEVINQTRRLSFYGWMILGSRVLKKLHVKLHQLAYITEVRLQRSIKKPISHVSRSIYEIPRSVVSPFTTPCLHCWCCFHPHWSSMCRTILHMI